MVLLKVDMEPSSYLWTNSSLPVKIITNQGNSDRNAIQACPTGTNVFQINLNTLYSQSLPLVSQLDTISFYTYRDANADNKDWYISLVLNRDDPAQDPDTPEFFIYPRNASNYEYYEDLWMLVDQQVLVLENNGSQQTFAQFVSGAYASYKITAIKVGTEQLAGFNGMISDIDITFTGKDDLQFLMEFSTSSTVIGGPDSSIFVQNKNIQFNANNQSVFILDGNNGTLTIQGAKLNILSTLTNNLDMGGFSLTNLGNPVGNTQVANKQYVDQFFDQMVAQMQWFSSTLNTNTTLTYTSETLTQNIDLLSNVNPNALYDTIEKLSDNSFQLSESNFRVELVLKIKYMNKQSYPLDLQLTEIDGNGNPINASEVTYTQTTFKPFGLDQYVTSSLFTTFAISSTAKFRIQLISPVAQQVVVRADSSIYINRLFDQSAGGTYQPISTSYTPLNLITAPTDNVSLHSKKITNLANATLDTDALNRQTADSRYYQQTATLDEITAPTDNVSLNSNKITNLADATLSTDALNQASGDSRYYLNSVKLNEISAPTSSLSLNSQKITSLGDATLATDAMNRQSSDARYYQNTVTLNQITAPTSSLSLNSQKITSLADATLATDALNRQTGDSRYYLSTTTLNSITAPTSSVSLNTQKITGLADATLATDAMNRQSSDARYYLGTTTLNSITAPTGSVSLNSQKITSLGDATLATDAMNRQSSDARYYQSTVTLDSITAPTSSVSLNAQKITSLGDATLATDALNRQTGDSRYYLSTTTLNSITAPTSSVSLNSQKITSLGAPTLSTDASTKGYVDTQIANIVNAAPSTLDTLNELAAALNNDASFSTTITNLIGTKLNTSDFNTTFATRYGLTPITSAALPTSSVNFNLQKITSLGDATLATDAMNRQSSDARYYLNTVTLNSITAPTGSLSLNSQKITALADATLATDAMNRQSSDARYYLSTTVLNSITAPTASLSLNSQKIINLATPTLNTDAATKAYVDQNVGISQSSADSRYYLATTTLNSISAPTSSLSLNSQRITNLADPVNNQDAVTLSYFNANSSSGSSSLPFKTVQISIGAFPSSTSSTAVTSFSGFITQCTKRAPNISETQARVRLDLTYPALPQVPTVIFSYKNGTGTPIAFTNGFACTVLSVSTTLAILLISNPDITLAQAGSTSTASVLFILNDIL